MHQVHIGSSPSDLVTATANIQLRKRLQSADTNRYKNSSGDEIANVNFFYNIAHVEASAYAH